MATTIRNLLVRLGVDADDNQARNFDAAITGAKRAMVAAAAAAGTLAVGIGSIVRSTANAGDEAAKMGKELGTSAEAMQELEFAAAITGTSVAEISTGLRRLNRGAVDASQGVGRAGDAFKKLNIEVKDGQGEFRDSLDIFEETLGALTSMESNVERAALAQDLLGRSGTKLLRIAERGGMTIGELRDQAQSLGFVMSDEAAASSEEFNDALTMMQFWLRGVRNQIGLAFMPQITAVINRTREWLIANRAIIDAGVEKGIDLIRASIEGVRNAASRIDEIVNKWTDWNTVLTTIGSTIAGLGILKFIPMLIAGIKGVTAVVLALLGPLGLKIAAIIALGLIIQDLIVWFRGGESAIGNLVARIGEITIIQRAREWLVSLRESVRDLFTELMDGRLGQFVGLVQDFIGVLSGHLTPVLESLIATAQAFWGAFSTAMALIRAIFVRTVTSLFSLWRTYMGFLIDIAKRVFGVIADILMWFWEAAMLPLINRILAFFVPILDAVIRYFKMTFEMAEDILSFFLAIVEGDFDSFGEIVSAAVELVQGHLERLGEFLMSIFQIPIDHIRSIFEATFKWISDMIEATIGRITGAIDSVKGLADGVKNVGSSVKGAAGKLPGVGRFIGGDEAADDVANTSRGQSVQNTALAMNRGDINLDIDIGGTDSSADDIAGTVSDQIRRQMDRERRQAGAAFGGGDI